MKRPSSIDREVVLLRIKDTNPGPSTFTRLNSNTEVHGLKYNHPSYELVYVPRDAVVESLIPTTTSGEENARPSWDTRGIQLSKSRSITKALVAVLQLSFSIFVLVRSRANQIEIYGYAAFSLTVAPYAVMAAVNLLANAVMPTYPSLYLVRNDVMIEIEEANKMAFDNVVGTVRQVSDTTAKTRLEVDTHMESQDRHIRGIPGMPPDTAAQLMTPDQAVAKGLLPRNVIIVPSCVECETCQISPVLPFLKL